MMKRNENGFTLLELMIYISMVSLLMLAMVGFFGMMLNSRIKSQTISEVEQQGKFAMENIAQTVRNSTALTTPAAAASGATLQVSVPTGTLSPTIFSLNGTVLQVKEGSSNAVAMTDGKVSVTNLTFKNLTRSGTPGVVQISFTVTKVNSVNKAEYAYSETFTTSVTRRAP